jgi:hypothetical protein
VVRSSNVSQVFHNNKNHAKSRGEIILDFEVIDS